MATLISSYPTPYMYKQQQMYYPIAGSSYVPQTYNNSYYTAQTQQQPTSTAKYVDSEIQSIRPRRQPRIYREVIVLPTPEPIYRQVRHRLPTPERQVVQRTVIQKANGDVVVQQQQSPKKPRSYSRQEGNNKSHSSRSRQIQTD